MKEERIEEVMTEYGFSEFEPQKEDDEYTRLCKIRDNITILQVLVEGEIFKTKRNLKRLKQMRQEVKKMLK